MDFMDLRGGCDAPSPQCNRCNRCNRGFTLSALRAHARMCVEAEMQKSDYIGYIDYTHPNADSRATTMEIQ